ncbi:Partitioning defective 3 [Mactra antiquata]
MDLDCIFEDDTDPSKDDDHKPIIKGSLGPKEKEKTPPFSRFARDSWRQSLGNQPSMFKWLEAQERQEERIKQQPERPGPVGGSTVQDGDNNTDDIVKPPLPPMKKEVGILICLKNDGTPLGIHVVPDFDPNGRESGLMVQGIDVGGRIDQDGRLKMEDRIIEINGYDLHNITFPKAQEIFRNAMKTDEVRLKVVKHSVARKPPPPALLPKPRGHSPNKPSPLSLPPQKLDLSSPESSPADTSTPLDKNSSEAPSTLSQDSQSDQQSSSSKNSQPISASSPIKSQPIGKRAPPPAPPQRHPSTTLSSNSQSEIDAENDNKKDIENKSGSSSPSPSASGTLTKNREAIIAPTNTKKIGKRYEITLVKGAVGLGFSITTRDNATGGPSPIYIKNILPKGAAVTDGRLKAGDRLLEVNGVEMIGKTQGDAVSMLRNMPLGSNVNIVVSRQEVEDPENDRFKVPRELQQNDLDPTENDLETDHQILQPAEKAGDDGTLAVMKNKELIEFNIPLTNYTGSAGLGVSVKGKTLTTEEGTRDLGIFVKAVIYGGAASKDGRLKVNDQLLEVNSTSLINHSNTEAMDLLRTAMQTEGPVPGCINIKVARRIGVTSPTHMNSHSFEDADWGTGEKELNNNDSLDQTDHVINEGRKSPMKVHNGDIPSNFKSPNLFLERVMAGNGLRNESYTKATHESFAGTPEPPRRRDNLVDLSKQRPRPHSTLGIERGPPHSNSSSSEDLNKEPAWIHGPDWTRHASQTSEESEPAGDGFSRDGFGRQSMSEKRKGHSDPRSSEIYQKVRGLKELNKANIRGPPSNLKRFSSLENLATVQDPDAGQELDFSGSFEDDETSPQPRMARRRGGNESFRAAVDRSYDPVPKLDMDPSDEKESSNVCHGLQRRHSVEEEGSEGGSIGRDLVNSARSSTSENYTDDKKKGGKKNKEARRSGGLLKGFFKFGKGRKTPVDEIGKVTKTSSEHKDNIDGEGNTVHKDHIEQEEQKWRQAQHEQERAQQEYRRVQEQHYMDQHKQTTDGRDTTGGQFAGHYAFKPPEPHSMGHSAPVISNTDLHRDAPVNRAERIQQLRADHQRRHLERHGHYPSEDKEEEYERQIQEEERRARRYTSDQDYFFYQKYGQSAIPSQLDNQEQQRSRPSSRNQGERPNSRLGSADFVQGTSNYQDYRDIQQPGTRLHSDSNVSKYSNFYRPPSRGQTTLTDQNYQPVHMHSSQYSGGLARGPTPTHERNPQHSLGIQRGVSPSQEQERNFRTNSSGNYQVVHKTQTPQSVNFGDKFNYSDESDVRRGNVNVDRTNVNFRPEVLPPSGGNYGNSSYAYRDPVFSSMAGKRPVKSLSQQPNSAKV